MKKNLSNLNFYFLCIFLLMLYNGFSTSQHLKNFMEGVEIVQGIYSDFSNAMSSGIDVNSSLTDAEKDNRYYLIFKNYLSKYSMNNRNIADMGGGDYNLFRDMYKEVEEGLLQYVFKNKNDLKKEWSRYPSKADCIIDKVHEALFVLERKKEYKKNKLLILDFKNNLDSLFLDYAQEEKNLQNIVNDFIALESQSSGLTNLEKELFQNFIDGKKIAQKEMIEVFNLILQGESLLDYKSKQYLEKKNSLDKIMNKINKLIADIETLISKQDSLVTDIVYKKHKNSFSAAAGQNKGIKKVLDNMNFIIENGNIKKKPISKYAHFL
jgi:hypothetical protein